MVAAPRQRSTPGYDKRVGGANRTELMQAVGQMDKVDNPAMALTCLSSEIRAPAPGRPAHAVVRQSWHRVGIRAVVTED